MTNNLRHFKGFVLRGGGKDSPTKRLSRSSLGSKALKKKNIIKGKGHRKGGKVFGERKGGGILKAISKKGGGKKSEKDNKYRSGGGGCYMTILQPESHSGPVWGKQGTLRQKRKT